jgi:hypothetical protein
LLNQMFEGRKVQPGKQSGEHYRLPGAEQHPLAGGCRMRG